MANPTPVQINEEQKKRAENMWHGFTQLMKWSVIATIAILAIMTLVFIA